MPIGGVSLSKNLKKFKLKKTGAAERWIAFDQLDGNRNHHLSWAAKIPSLKLFQTKLK